MTANACDKCPCDCYYCGPEGHNSGATTCCFGHASYCITRKNEPYWVGKPEPEPEPELATSITCPICHLTSFHPDDIANGYCGNCHAWTSPSPRSTC